MATRRRSPTRIYAPSFQEGWKQFSGGYWAIVVAFILGLSGGVSLADRGPRKLP